MSARAAYVAKSNSNPARIAKTLAYVPNYIVSLYRLHNVAISNKTLHRQINCLP